MRRPPPPSSELERLVRYCHPAKILGTTRLPGTLSEAALAGLYGVSPDRYRAVAAAIAAEAAAAARDLPPLQLDGPLLALGDSHTDDLASWAEVLGAVLDVPVINAGVSGDTTTAARARLARLPPAAHAVVLLGTNDARRHGDQDMLVSHDETARNVRAIDRELRRRCGRVTWITPPPVDERRISADPALREAEVSWRREDVAAKAGLVRDAWPDAIDLWPAFDASCLAADGLHPSATGQRVIAERVLTANRSSIHATAKRTRSAAGKR
jgi:lysophospholipase L1-like esterase